MSVGLGLLRAVIGDRIPISRLPEEGVLPEHFLPGDETVAYNFIHQYSRDLGGLPQLDTVAIQLQNPRTLLRVVQEPFEFWIPRVKDRLRVARMDRGMSAVRTEISSGNIESAVDAIGNLYLELRESYGRRVVSSLDIQRQALQHHNQVQRGEIPPGLPYGFPYLDEISGGMQQSDFVVLVGDTGVGKTGLSLAIARNCHQQGRSVLYLSTEVSLLQLGRRMLALDFRQNLYNIKLGRLSSFRSSSLEASLQDSPQGQSVPFFDFLPGGIYSSLNDVLLAAKDRNPDLLVVDGAYMLRILSKNNKTPRWDILMSIVEELKNFALNQNIPVLATYQYGTGSSGNLEGIAGTYAIRQFASVVLSLEFERREDALNPAEARYRVLKVLKGREGESGSVRLLFDFDETAILQDRVISGGILRQILGNEGPEPEESPEDALVARI